MPPALGHPRAVFYNHRSPCPRARAPCQEATVMRSSRAVTKTQCSQNKELKEQTLHQASCLDLTFYRKCKGHMKSVKLRYEELSRTCDPVPPTNKQGGKINVGKAPESKDPTRPFNQSQRRGLGSECDLNNPTGGRKGN